MDIEKYSKIAFRDFDQDTQILVQRVKEGGKVLARLHHPMHHWDPELKEVEDALRIAEREKASLNYEIVVSDEIVDKDE